MALRYNAGELITAMVTPMNKDYSVDYASLENMVKYLIEEQANDAIVVAGTTGECPTLPMKKNKKYYIA